MTEFNFTSIFFAVLFVALPVVFVSLVLGIPQYFLSKNKNRWFGLILPTLSFIYATGVSLSGFVSGLYWIGIIQFSISNIITIILLTIYWYVKKQNMKKSEIRKMTIEDLE